MIQDHSTAVAVKIAIYIAQPTAGPTKPRHHLQLSAAELLDICEVVQCHTPYAAMTAVHLGLTMSCASLAHDS